MDSSIRLHILLNCWDGGSLLYEIEKAKLGKFSSKTCHLGDNSCTLTVLSKITHVDNIRMILDRKSYAKIDQITYIN